MLKILSAANWCMAGLYVVGLVFLWVVGHELPMEALLAASAVLLLLAAPFAYLGYAIELGRGRTLQTVFAALSLFNVPIGTLFGLFALWVCWSVEREAFEDSGLPTPDDDATAVRGSARVVRARAPEAEHWEADAATPYSMAQLMKQEGATPRQVQQKLEARGLEREEIETVMNALGLRYARAR